MPGVIRHAAMHSRGSDRRQIDPAGACAPCVVPDRRRHMDRRRLGFISQMRLFASIPYQAIEHLLADCTMREVPAGTVLLEPGQANHAIHLLVEGRLHIHFGSADSADYVAITQGECAGELSIIDGRPVSAYVVAVEPSRILMIHETVFWDHLIPYPGVARNLLRTLSERMRVNGGMILKRLEDTLTLQHLQKELAVANAIQSSMLPAGDRLFPDHAEVQAYAVMEPAKEVGGDFYDAFFVAPHHLFVAVGDVSGKGIPAALFMARTIGQLRMEAGRRRAPSAILDAVNRALCEGNDTGIFVTLFCGVLNTQNGQFSFANAGHNPPLLLRAHGACDFLPVKKGLLAGFVPDVRYPVAKIRLKPGDSVLVYTDGVTEAADPGGDLYTESRLLSAARNARQDDPRALINTIRASIASFGQGAPQADDITLLALRYCSA